MFGPTTPEDERFARRMRPLAGMADLAEKIAKISGMEYKEVVDRITGLKEIFDDAIAQVDLNPKDVEKATAELEALYEMYKSKGE